MFMLEMNVGVDSLWRRYCGSCAAVRSGGCCLRRMEVGIAYSSDFHAGVSMACGTDYWLMLPQTPICNMC